MEDVDLRHAKEHLEDLIARAARGEDVRIVDPTVGTVRLTILEPAREAASSRREHVPGRLKGKITVPVRLLEPMSEDELTDWYGESK